MISKISFFTEVREYQSESRTFICIDKQDRTYFPDTREKGIIIETYAGTVSTHILEDGRIPKLKKWYDHHSNLKNLKYKDKIKVTVLENKRRYQIEAMEHEVKC